MKAGAVIKEKDISRKHAAAAGPGKARLAAGGGQYMADLVDPAPQGLLPRFTALQINMDGLNCRCPVHPPAARMVLLSHLSGRLGALRGRL